MQISDKIKAIRKYYGMSQAEFAKKLGTTRANYSNIENGYVRPTQMLINCLSAMYGLSCFRFDQMISKGKMKQFYCFYIIASLSLGYLLASFILDFVTIHL